jgi:hypothetical protein
MDHLTNSIWQAGEFARLLARDLRRQRLIRALDTITLIALVCAAALILARAVLTTLAALPILTAPIPGL